LYLILFNLCRSTVDTISHPHLWLFNRQEAELLFRMPAKQWEREELRLAGAMGM
jgi:hypothetical protein